ncbi:MAG: arginase family protein [Candidatus Dormibacteria bacterium]
MRADAWIVSGGEGADFCLAGAPTAALSLSPSHAEQTPAAFRASLNRFPTWDAEHRVDLTLTSCRDAGDADMTGDPLAARERLLEMVAGVAARCSATVVCGGDNSVTVPAFLGLARARAVELDSGRIGLLTLDAHHDLRPPDPRPSNGSPVAELLQLGLPGSCIVQVGIAPLGNDRAHTAAANAHGIAHYGAHEVRARGLERVLEEALSRIQGDVLYVDFDLDVLDRAFAPACPASLPGGLQPDELREAAFRLGRETRVAAIDLVEVDASADRDLVTLRNAQQVFLSFCVGRATRFNRADPARD